MTAPTEPITDRWKAELELVFRRAGKSTELSRDRHIGPLRVQRPFLEPNGTCQVYVLHPPGGVASVDELSLRASAEPGARALLTTPGATKLYRSGGQSATLCQELEIAPGARIEWLPQETIVFDGAVARSTTRVVVRPGARFAGWEIVSLGRPRSGERFERGRFVQSFELWCGDEPRFIDRSTYTGGDPSLEGAFGLGGRPVFGLFLLFPATEASLLRVREITASAAAAEFAASLVDDVLSCRLLGTSTARARALFASVWTELRPFLFDEAAHPPRIWAT